MVEPWSAVPEWIAKAEGDWEAMEILLTRNTPGLSDAVVFHAQQCVEKLLNARLIQLGQTVDKINDLAALSRQLEAVDGQWSWDGEELVDLSSGAVLARYPGAARTGAVPQQAKAGPEGLAWRNNPGRMTITVNPPGVHPAIEFSQSIALERITEAPETEPGSVLHRAQSRPW